MHSSAWKKNKHNLKASWRILKNIISKNKNVPCCSRFHVNDRISNDKKSISGGFNSYFVNVVPTLAKQIPSDGRSPTTCMQENQNDMAVLPVVRSEVISIIKNLKPSPGWDSISATVVKDSYASFLEPLTYEVRELFP